MSSTIHAKSCHHTVTEKFTIFFLNPEKLKTCANSNLRKRGRASLGAVAGFLESRMDTLRRSFPPRVLKP